MSRTPQQSKNWDKYINEIPFKFRIKLLNKTKYCEEGFPRYIYSDKGMIRFTLILRNGEIIENAILDNSRQYMSEGSQWRNGGRVINEFQVLAWKEIMDEEENK